MHLVVIALAAELWPSLRVEVSGRRPAGCAQSLSIEKLLRGALRPGLEDTRLRPAELLHPVLLKESGGLQSSEMLRFLFLGVEFIFKIVAPLRALKPPGPEICWPKGLGKDLEGQKRGRVDSGEGLGSLILTST